MKVPIDETSYITIKEEYKSVILSIRTKDEDEKILIVSAKLDLKKVDDIIAKLISLKKNLV